MGLVSRDAASTTVDGSRFARDEAIHKIIQGPEAGLALECYFVA